MGGGMRQAGILAAAGIIALTEHPQLLAADHARAKKLANGLAGIKGISVNSAKVDINMVFFNYSGPALTDNNQCEKIAAEFEKRGIKISPPDCVAGASPYGAFRFVTHYWIGDKETDAVIKAAQEIFA
jgi:threonine aldolase